MLRLRPLSLSLILALLLGAIAAAPALGQEAEGAEEADALAAEEAPEELAEDEENEALPATVRLRLRGLSDGKLKAGNKVKVNGTLRPWAAGEQVTVLLFRGNKVVKRKRMFARLKKGKSYGTFKFSARVIRSGRYTVQAVKRPTEKLRGAKDRTRAFRIRYPDLNPGQRNSRVALLNRLLAKRGYATSKGKKYGGPTERAILAFRKVNRMSRITDANSSIFKKLANGKGGYKVRYPRSGKHVEVDISRQVMALVNGDKVHRVYHVSTGAPATPTPAGTWRFYRKEPGLNNVGMYYSVYYNRGYATHGYKSVPTYPASHGCTRNPPPDSKYIYNWISIGDLIHLYH